MERLLLVLQPVPEKMRLEMLVETQIKTLDELSTSISSLIFSTSISSLIFSGVHISFQMSRSKRDMR